MTEQEQRRRSSLLATLSFEQPASVHDLRAEMQAVHGVVASADLIRADLGWLAEMGLVRCDGDAAMCTERGMDVARRRAPFPGAL
ncbi:hypothetical protein ABWL39_20385 [Chitinivorax sp. PXF-14]|uniref:hypothetical protein n=1 Tax=Chitinivorax sp. PXF-14 TaxID=3230488 RepID=UPI0034668623